MKIDIFRNYSMNAYYVCELLTNYAKANPSDADRALYTTEIIIKENRGYGFKTENVFELEDGQTEDEFIRELIDTINSERYIDC